MYLFFPYSWWIKNSSEKPQLSGSETNQPIIRHSSRFIEWYTKWWCERARSPKPPSGSKHNTFTFVYVLSYHFLAAGVQEESHFPAYVIRGIIRDWTEQDKLFLYLFYRIIHMKEEIILKIVIYICLSGIQEDFPVINMHLLSG